MIYFDNAATSYKRPEAVIEAVVFAMTHFGNAGRGIYDASLDAFRMLYDTREKLAELFDAQGPENVAFTPNATESLNIAINGLFEKGDHVITTELEHNSVLRPLYRKEAEGMELSIVKIGEKAVIAPADIEAEIKSNTRAVICTHGSNLTGNVMDIRRIGEICRRHSLLFIVDASQTAGILQVSMKDNLIDVLCFTGHKGLMGPQGTGGICVRSGIEIRPLKVGGSGEQTYQKIHPKQMPAALEAGTLNCHGLAGLNAALDYIKEKGTETIYRSEINLMQRFYKGIRDVPGVHIYGDISGKWEQRVPIVSLNIRKHGSGEISDMLYTEYGIVTRAGGHCAPLLHEALGTREQGAVRFSFSHYNTEEEVDYAIEAVRSLA